MAKPLCDNSRPELLKEIDAWQQFQTLNEMMNTSCMHYIHHRSITSFVGCFFFLGGVFGMYWQSAVIMVDDIDI